VVGLAAAGVLWLAFDRPQASLVVASIALALAAIAFVWPRSLHRTITRGLERFARAVAMAVTWVLMTVLFFLVFLPLGLALRAAGKLAITRRPDRRLASYWVPVPDHKPSLDSYRRQF
jgi:phosphate/sulfate permease